MKHLMLFEQFLLEKNPMEVTSKDDMRINDIIRKSGGDSSKAEALARTMASRITDYYKAVRRASAAQSAGRSDLAQIFRDRSKELNEELNEGRRKDVDNMTTDEIEGELDNLRLEVQHFEMYEPGRKREIEKIYDRMDDLKAELDIRS